MLPCDSHVHSEWSWDSPAGANPYDLWGRVD
jgi:hypothetical protein